MLEMAQNLREMADRLEAEGLALRNNASALVLANETCPHNTRWKMIKDHCGRFVRWCTDCNQVLASGDPALELKLKGINDQFSAKEAPDCPSANCLTMWVSSPVTKEPGLTFCWTHKQVAEGEAQDCTQIPPGGWPDNPLAWKGRATQSGAAEVPASSPPVKGWLVSWNQWRHWVIENWRLLEERLDKLEEAGRSEENTGGYSPPLAVIGRWTKPCPCCGANLAATLGWQLLVTSASSKLTASPTPGASEATVPGSSTQPPTSE